MPVTQAMAIPENHSMHAFFMEYEEGVFKSEDKTELT